MIIVVVAAVAVGAVLLLRQNDESPAAIDTTEATTESAATTEQVMTITVPPPGGDTATSTSVVPPIESSGGELDSCEALADAGIEMIQKTIDEIGSMSEDELAALNADSPVLSEMDRSTEELDARSAELGCSDAEMQRLAAERFERLTAEPDNIVGQYLIDELGAELFGLG